MFDITSPGNIANAYPISRKYGQQLKTYHPFGTAIQIDQWFQIGLIWLVDPQVKVSIDENLGPVTGSGLTCDAHVQVVALPCETRGCGDPSAVERGGAVRCPFQILQGVCHLSACPGLV